MLGTPTATKAPPVDSSRSALEFVHRLLATPNAGQPDLAGLLAGLADAFAVAAAGLATLPDGVPLSVHPAPADPRSANCRYRGATSRSFSNRFTAQAPP